MKGKRLVKVVEADGREFEESIFLPQIRSVIGFLKGTLDLNPYADCFPSKCKLGDIDGTVEVFGHTLVVEFKVDRATLNKGQVIKAVRQAKYGNVTTFFVFRETNRPKEYLRFSPNCIEGTGFVSTDVSKLKASFRTWSHWARKNTLLPEEIASKYC